MHGTPSQFQEVVDHTFGARQRQYVRTQKEYLKEIVEQKKRHWIEFLESLSGPDIWLVNQYMKSSDRYNRIPHLQKPTGGKTQTEEEKVAVLRESLLPKTPASKIPAPQAGPDPLWPDLTAEELQLALGEMAPNEAPGPDQFGHQTRLPSLVSGISCSSYWLASSAVEITQNRGVPPP